MTKILEDDLIDTVQSLSMPCNYDGLSLLDSISELSSNIDALSDVEDIDTKEISRMQRSCDTIHSEVETLIQTAFHASVSATAKYYPTINPVFEEWFGLNTVRSIKANAAALSTILSCYDAQYYEKVVPLYLSMQYGHHHKNYLSEYAKVFISKHSQLDESLAFIKTLLLDTLPPATVQESRKLPAAFIDISRSSQSNDEEKSHKKVFFMLSIYKTLNPDHLDEIQNSVQRYLPYDFNYINVLDTIDAFPWAKFHNTNSIVTEQLHGAFVAALSNHLKKLPEAKSDKNLELRSIIEKRLLTLSTLNFSQSNSSPTVSIAL